MSNWLSLPILALAAVLQATFVPQIRLLGGAPDLVFLFVISWAIHSPLETGVTWAFVGGILQDLLSAAPTGASSLGMVIVVFGIHQINRQVYRVGFILLVSLVLVGTLVQQTTIMLILMMTGFRIHLIENFTYIILPTIAYNLVFIWPIYWLVRRLQRRFLNDARVREQV
jgi:rod shape-determining protein MreD